jgi:hypothetical protein
MGTVKGELDCKVSNFTNDVTNKSLYYNNNRIQLIALEGLAQGHSVEACFLYRYMYIYIYKYICIYTYINI